MCDQDTQLGRTLPLRFQRLLNRRSHGDGAGHWLRRDHRESSQVSMAPPRKGRPYDGRAIRRELKRERVLKGSKR